MQNLVSNNAKSPRQLPYWSTQEHYLLMDAASADGLEDYVMLDVEDVEEAVSDIHTSVSSNLTFGRCSWQTLST